MIESFRNFQTPKFPKKQKHSNLRFSGYVLAVLFLGCAGKNIHTGLKPNPLILVRQWTLQTHGPFEAGDRGTEFSNPIGIENTLVFGNQSHGLTSLYPSLMQTRWSLPIPKGVLSELAVDQNNIYFGGGDGFLYCVSAENGRVQWRYDLHNPIISKPTLSQGRVFVTTSDDTVYAFDAGTGKWLWHYRRRTSSNASIMGASSPLVDGNDVLAGLSDGFLVALSLHEGHLKWEKKLHQGSKFTDVDAHPVLEQDVLYIPSYDGALYALKKQDGTVLWRFDAGGSKQVVLDHEVLYLPSSEGKIYALQKNNAKVLWKFELDAGTPTALVSTEKYLIFGSSHRYFYALDKNTGVALYRYDVGYDNGFYGSPYFDASLNRLYALSSAGNLYSFEIRAPLKKERPHAPLFEF